MPRKKPTAITVNTGDKAEPISGSPMTAFDAFVEENFAKRKRLAQLDRTQLAEAWARNWNLFWEQCEKDFPGMNTLEIQAAMFKSQFDFVSAQRFADKLSTNSERLAFFITAKSHFDQSGPQDFLTGRGLLNEDVLRFGDQCELEINKYNQLVELEKEQDSQTEDRLNAITKGLLNRLDRKPLGQVVGPRPWGVPDARGYLPVGERHFSEWTGGESKPELKMKGKANKDEGELTVEQAAIFFHYFFEFAKLKPGLADAKKIAVIHAVTRWSPNSIANIIYDKKGGGVFRKANGEDYTTFELDMTAVKSLYQKLQLLDVVAKIDADIEDIGGNL